MLPVLGVVPLALGTAGDVLVVRDLLTLVSLPVVFVDPVALPALTADLALSAPASRLLVSLLLVVPALLALPVVPVLPLSRPELLVPLPVLDLLRPALLSLAPAILGLPELGLLVPVLLEPALPVSVLLVLAPVFPPADVALLVAPGHLLLAVLGRPLPAASGPADALRGLLLVQAGLRVALPGVLVDVRALVPSALPSALCLPSAAPPVSVLLAHRYHVGRIETSRP